MIKKELFSNVLTLAWNLLLVYVCYTLCRLAFLFVNWDTFSGNLSWGYTISLLGAGIIFAQLYTLLYQWFCIITGLSSHV